MFAMAKEKAFEAGARKICFLSATNESAVDFYLSVGFTPFEKPPAREFWSDWDGKDTPDVPNADFRIYVVEDSSAVRWRVNSDDTCYEDSNYSIFTSDIDRNDDGYFEVWTIQ